MKFYEKDQKNRSNIKISYVEEEKEDLNESISYLINKEVECFKKIYKEWCAGKNK